MFAGAFKRSESDLVALDVPVLSVHRRRVPCDVQLGGCGRLNGHILGRGGGNCGGPAHRLIIQDKTRTFFSVIVSGITT